MTLDNLLKKHRPMAPSVIKDRKAELNSKQFASEIWFERYLVTNNFSGYRRNVCLEKRFFGDFVFRKFKLVVEIDGNSHTGKEAYDKSRDLLLSHLGYRVVRVKYKNENDLRKALSVLKALITPNKARKIKRPLEGKLLSRSQKNKKENKKKLQEYDLEKKRHQIIIASKKPYKHMSKSL